jgi:5-methylcytosine-specific restriction endonuclease McrA
MTRDRTLKLYEPPPKRWCIYCDQCVMCGTREDRHAADGMCARCYEQSPERAATYARYRHTDGRKQSRRAWKTRNAELEATFSRYRSRRRRGRESGVEDVFPPWLEPIVFSEFANRCACCGAIADLCLDHHRPLREGNGLVDNAVVLCLACNSRKENRLPEEFYEELMLREIERRLAWCRALRLVAEHDRRAA